MLVLKHICFKAHFHRLFLWSYLIKKEISNMIFLPLFGVAWIDVFSWSDQYEKSGTGSYNWKYVDLSGSGSETVLFIFSPSPGLLSSSVPFYLFLTKLRFYGFTALFKHSISYIMGAKEWLKNHFVQFVLIR